jgi:hypothetical protein
MKKILIMMMVIAFFVLFSACQTDTTTSKTTSSSTQTTTQTTQTSTATQTETTVSSTETTELSKLDIVGLVGVLDNIITFSSVENAQKYRIYIYGEDDVLLGEYNITNGFNLALLLGVGTYKFQIKAMSPGFIDSDLTVIDEFQIVDLLAINVLEGSQMNNHQYIRWLGRNYYNEVEEVKYFYFTASGFEVAFYGTELKAVLKASNYNVYGKQPHLVVLIDGEDDSTKGSLIVLDQAEGEYTLVEGLEEGYHTVKLLKRSEAIDSNTALKSLSTDGTFTNPPQPKSFSIQFIAASSSTGYGNLGTLQDSKTTANSDGLNAFAYLTTFMLDAEISIFSASGWGVSRGYNTPGFSHNPSFGGISEVENIPNAFEYVAIDASNRVLTALGKWDISNFIPDVIVVNLGTNDFNASSYRTMSTEDKTALEDRFKADYVDFLVLLNNMYPNAKIIVAYGLMNEQGLLEAITLEIINLANSEIGQTVVFAFEMEGAGTNSNPYGANYHPNVQTSINVARDLADYIHELTGREIVRNIYDE